MALRPFVSVPEDLREWSRWMEDQAIIADDDSVTTAMLQDESVTYAKIQDVSADRILGRLTTDGVVSELTASDVVTLLQAEGWTFGSTVQFDGNVGFYGTTPVAQQSDITDASVAHNLNATFSDTEVEAALDALGTKINAILDVFDNLGLTA